MNFELQWIESIWVAPHKREPKTDEKDEDGWNGQQKKIQPRAFLLKNHRIDKIVLSYMEKIVYDSPVLVAKSRFISLSCLYGF